MFNCTLHYGQGADLGHLESIDRFIFSALYHSLGIITFIVNSLVCCTMIKTGMWKKNQSFKALFGYSFTKSLHGAFGCNILGYVMNRAESLSCVQVTILFFSPNIFGYSSHGTVMSWTWSIPRSLFFKTLPFQGDIKEILWTAIHISDTLCMDSKSFVQLYRQPSIWLLLFSQ